MKKEELIKKAPIIIPEIYGMNPICDYLPQTVKCLTKRNYPVIVFLINYPAKRFTLPKFNNLKINYYFPQHILPFNRFKLVQKIQVYLSFNILSLYCYFKYKVFPIYWIFYPHIHRLIKYSIKPQTLIYDIIDFYPGYNEGKKYFLSSSKVIVAISQELKKNYLKYFPPVSINLVPQGFKLIKSKSLVHPKIKKIDNLQNKVGFIGAINNRLDFNLLFELIPATPDINYIFIGPIDTDSNTSSKPIDTLISRLFSFKNVYHIGLISKEQIRQFIDNLDVTMIPYDTKDDFNRLCYPMKLFEYFAAGKPVISTAIEELKKFPNLVFVSNTAKEWVKIINKIISKPWPKNLQIQEKILAKKNSWENKIDQILKLLPK
jgi:glycosyltransferase involved in cell wall biosynthesis